MPGKHGFWVALLTVAIVSLFVSSCTTSVAKSQIVGANSMMELYDRVDKYAMPRTATGDKIFNVVDVGDLEGNPSDGLHTEVKLHKFATNETCLGSVQIVGAYGENGLDVLTVTGCYPAGQKPEIYVGGKLQQH